MTRAEAIERINARQNAMNLFTNIGEDEIQQEMNGATLRDVRNWIMNNWRRDDRPTEIERREYSDNHRLIKYSDGTSYEYIKKDIRSDHNPMFRIQIVPQNIAREISRTYIEFIRDLKRRPFNIGHYLQDIQLLLNRECFPCFFIKLCKGFQMVFNCPACNSGSFGRRLRRRGFSR